MIGGTGAASIGASKGSSGADRGLGSHSQIDQGSGLGQVAQSSAATEGQAQVYHLTR